MGDKIKVAKKEGGQRLDLWLQAKLPGTSRKQAKALLDAGKVLINDRRVVIAGWEVTEGDEIEVRSLPERASQGQDAQQPPQQEPRRPELRHEARQRAAGVSASIDRHFARRKARRKAKDRPVHKEPPSLKVYYQDRDVIVVEKPGGLLSVPNDKSDSRDNLLERVRLFLRRKFRGGKASFVSPLHRLDAETSGIMLFALSREGQRLTNQFKEHSIQRSYQAIVQGRIERENGVIDKPLEKGEFGEGKKVREAAGPSGMKAITEYSVKERYKNATLLDVRVRTGRTHQIRVHLASEGFPILGDALYAKELGEKNPELMDEVDRTLGFRRHALHASSIGFKHPSNGRKMNFNSPTPEDMKALVDSLRTG